MINMHSIFSYSCYQALHIPYHYVNAGTKDTYCLNSVVENTPAPFASRYSFLLRALTGFTLSAECPSQGSPPLARGLHVLLHSSFDFQICFKIVLVYINYIAGWALWEQCP